MHNLLERHLKTIQITSSEKKNMETDAEAEASFKMAKLKNNKYIVITKITSLMMRQNKLERNAA